MTDPHFLDELPPALPKPGGHPGRIQRLIRECQEHPGKWAVAQAGVMYSAARKPGQYPGTEWAARRQPDGTITTYVRWVGLEGGGRDE